MNLTITAQEEILSACRQLIMDKGFSAVNMRAVAAACGVSVGSVYNYFPSKGDLLSAVVESVWHDIFHVSGEASSFSSFPECVQWLFDSIRHGCKGSPEFFTLHSMSFAAAEKDKGRTVMKRYFQHIHQSLLHVLEQDSQVLPGTFQGALTREAFVDMVFSLVTDHLMEGKTECSALIGMITLCLYGNRESQSE